MVNNGLIGLRKIVERKASTNMFFINELIFGKCGFFTFSLIVSIAPRNTNAATYAGK